MKRPAFNYLLHSVLDCYLFVASIIKQTIVEVLSEIDNFEIINLILHLCLQERGADVAAVNNVSRELTNC